MSSDTIAMRIGFDVSQTAESMTGCGVLASELLKALVAEAPAATFLPYPVFSGYRHAGFKTALRPAARNVEALHHDLDWETINAGWDRPDGLSDFLGNPTVVHSNSFGCPRLPVPIVYTVYDLSPLDRPEFHTEANRLVCFGGLFDASLRAERFIAISQYSRDRFLHWFSHVPADRVSVIYPAARFGGVDGQGDTAVLARMGLTSQAFWLSVGTIEARKNYSMLLTAYAGLVARRPDTPPLYVAGKPGWKEAPIEERAAALGIGDRVRSLGFVADADLPALYRHATGFVYCSHYEGFGLPLIEALACGAPSIATNTTSLPEVIGDAGLLVEVNDAEGLAAAMARLLDEPSLRTRLREAAVTRASRFSWQDAARRTVAVYEACAKNRSAGRAPKNTR